MTLVSNAEMDASIRALLVARGMSAEGLACFDELLDDPSVTRGTE